MIKKIISLQFLLLFCLCMQTKAQVALKTSFTQLGTGTFNIEASVPVGKKVSLHLPVSYNPWKFGDNTRLQQLTVLPGVRLWRQQTNVHYFLSLYGIASRFHFGGLFDHKYRYDGRVFGGGVGGGYAWVLGPHWNLEAELGLGLGYADYDKCHWEEDSRRYKSCNGLRVFPAKVDLSISYFF